MTGCKHHGSAKDSRRGGERGGRLLVGVGEGEEEGREKEAGGLHKTHFVLASCFYFIAGIKYEEGSLSVGGVPVSVCGWWIKVDVSGVEVGGWGCVQLAEA